MTIVVERPGIYASIPMEAYHGQLTPSPSISSSGLRTIEQKSLAHYYAGSYLNPKAAKPDTQALRFGKAAHSLLLGDEVFSDHFIISPYDDFRTKAAREWRDETSASGLIVLKSSEFEDLQAMAEVLKREPLVQDGILDGDAERSIVWQDEETGVWLKARPDVLPAAGFVVDYKTTVDAHPIKIARDVFSYGYHQQLALVAEGMAALGLDVPTGFVLVFQEKTSPYAVTVQELEADAITAGARQNRKSIRKFAQALSEDLWPAYDIAPPVHAPDWIERRAEEVSAPAWLNEMENAA